MKAHSRSAASASGSGASGASSSSRAAAASTASATSWAGSPARAEAARLGAAGRALAAALDVLPGEARLVLSLLHLEGLTEAEAGAVLGTTEVQVRRIAREARCQLRAAIARFTPDA